jgi:hypothetical protein
MHEQFKSQQIRRMTDTVSGECKRGSVRNKVNELDWKKKDVNNMLVGTDWLNSLLDGGENKVT